MPEAVLTSALRTPIGTAFKGTLRDTTAFDLAHHVVTATADGLDPDLIDDVILGEGLATAEAWWPGMPRSRPGSPPSPGWPITGTALRAWPLSRAPPRVCGRAWTS